MASSFSNDSNEGINEINITPFVDVVLVLLVIFMVTTPMMVKESLSLKLPKATQADARKEKTLGVSINKKGEPLIDGKLVSMNQLESDVILTYNEFPELQILISADKEASHGSVIQVLDTIKKVGISNFAFQIERIVNE